MKVLVCAGEASGDALAAEALRGSWEARGIAGPALRAAGVTADVRAEDVVGMGIVEALGAVRRAPRVLCRIRRLLDAWRPDVVWTVDNPGLNLRIGAMARRRGIPVVHLGSPQVWAWRPSRVDAVARCVDSLLCLLPFEPRWYDQTGVRAVFVGHPAARVQHLERSPGLVVGLAPGSRPSEVASLWPAFRAAAERIRARCPDVRFRIAVAPTVEAPTDLDAVRCRGIAEAAEGAHAFLVATGTATVELAARGIPMVAACRVHPLTWAVGRRVVRVRHLALPNLLAGRVIVPEHLQDLDPGAMASDVLRVAADPGLPETLRGIAASLAAEGAAERIAAEVYRAGSQQVTVPNAASQRPHGVFAHLS